MFGITIDGKHTYTDYGLKMTGISVPLPEVKTNSIDVPYSDGNIDLSEVTGELYYSDRENIKFTFKLYDGDYKKWQAAVEKLASAIHGKKVQVILDNDPAYFYVMRLSINTSKTKMVSSTIEINGTAEPYKYAIHEAGADWEWDPFSFVDGVIMKLEDVEVTGSKTIAIDNSCIYTIPEFIVKSSTNLALSFGGNTYSMPSAGTYYFPQVRLTHDVISLTLTGSGTLDIHFRGKFL